MQVSDVEVEKNVILIIGVLLFPFAIAPEKNGASDFACWGASAINSKFPFWGVQRSVGDNNVGLGH